MARLRVTPNTHAVAAGGYEFVANDGHIETGNAPPDVIAMLVLAGHAHAPAEAVDEEVVAQVGEETDPIVLADAKKNAQARADEKQMLLSRLEASGRKVDRRTGLELLREMASDLPEA